ncbi:MAG TPA: hypothetical protein VF471_13805 [Pseudoxanthomonas sp.]
MKPFVLKQHDQDFSALRALRHEEMIQVYGGVATNPKDTGDIPKLNTVTSTPNGDGGDDGPDEG